MPTTAIQEFAPNTHTSPHASRFYTHNQFTIKVETTAAETNHTHSLIEFSVPGRFPGMPLHYHQKFIESFYILEGNLRLTRDDENLTAAPGSLVHMPRGAAHGYQNETDDPARFLVISTPGGSDTFFTTLIARMNQQPQWPPFDAADLADLGAQHDTYFL